jgi:hypothetical protein
MNWALSSVEKNLWVPLFWVFSVLDQARLGLDVLPVMLRDVRAGWRAMSRVCGGRGARLVLLQISWSLSLLAV